MHSSITTQIVQYLTHSDYLIAGLSELSLQDGLVGETFGNLIAEQFRRIKLGDRFWHETDDVNTRFDFGKLSS